MSKSGDVEECNKIKEEIKKRENHLEPMYHQAAVHFVELHETPERMLEKDAIKEIIPWKTARRQMYWRIRRRLLEREIHDEILKTSSDINIGQAVEMLGRWFVEDNGGQSYSYLWYQDEVVTKWIEAQRKDESSLLSENIASVRHNAIVTQIKEALDSCIDLKLDVVINLANSLDQNEKSKLLSALSMKTEK